MNRNLLQTVVRQAEAFASPGEAASDAELLARFRSRQDDTAFAELIRRHGPLVWSVCRQLLPNPADAEDTFQATFLALVQSSGSVRDGAALGGWLHGVAVRLATKVKRSAVRRKLRETKRATGEAAVPVADTAWNEMLAAVHEEVQRLTPDLRTAFVMCELEGVRQPEAAVRLGWKLGTLSGRLTRARQQILDRLSQRGIAAASASGLLGVGTISATGAVPAELVQSVLTLSAAPSSAPAALLQLALEVSPMWTRTKLIAATLLVACGLGVGVGAGVLSQAGAQAPPPPPTLPPPGADTGGPGARGPGAPPPPPRPADGPPRGAPTGGPDAGPGRGGPPSPPPTGPGGPGPNPGGFGRGGGAGFGSFGGGGMPGGGAPGGMGGGVISGTAGIRAWEYKVVLHALTRAGRGSRAAEDLNKILSDNGDQNWELVSITSTGSETAPSREELLITFKRPKFRGGVAGGPDYGGGVGFGGDVGPGGSRPGNMDEMYAASFRRRDTNNDGKLSREETRENAELMAVFAQSDMNKDGFIDLDEYLAYARARLRATGEPTPGGRGAQGGPSGPGGASGPGGSGGGRPSSFNPLSVLGSVGGGTTPAPAQELHVLKLKHADAGELARVLTSVFADRPIRITSDPRTNSLLISAPTNDMKAIEGLIEKLDYPIDPTTRPKTGR